MRFLLKASIPVEPGNKAIEEGSLGPRIQKVLADLKPEAAYFYEEDGCRTALLIVDLKEASGIPALVEPFFLRLNARVQLRPVMTPEDLGKAGLEDIAKRWGSGAK